MTSATEEKWKRVARVLLYFAVLAALIASLVLSIGYKVQIDKFEKAIYTSCASRIPASKAFGDSANADLRLYHQQYLLAKASVITARSIGLHLTPAQNRYLLQTRRAQVKAWHDAYVSQQEIVSSFSVRTCTQYAP